MFLMHPFCKEALWDFLQKALYSWCYLGDCEAAWQKALKDNLFSLFRNKIISTKSEGNMTCLLLLMHYKYSYYQSFCFQFDLSDKLFDSI